MNEREVVLIEFHFTASSTNPQVRISFAGGAAGYFILGFSNVPLLLLSAMLIATVGEIMFWPVRQKYLAELIPEDARSSYMAVNSLVFQGARVLASLSITLGAVITSFFMSTLYLIIGLTSIYLFHMVIGQIKRSKI